MARLPRLNVPGLVQYVVMKGNNQQEVFLGVNDYSFMLALIRNHAQTWRVDCHAYVLTHNQIHLLLTPHDRDSVPKLIQSIGREYVRRFNQNHHRTGTLWEGRYRSTVLDAASVMLDVMVFLDLKPVREGLVQRVTDYEWSSYAHYSGQRLSPWLVPHSQIWSLGNTPFAREVAYVQRVEQGLELSSMALIERAVQGGWPLGSEAFLRDLQQHSVRRLVPGSPGRPRAHKVTDPNK